MKNYRNILCTNCGTRGHILRECSDPITSFGIIAYKYMKTRDDDFVKDPQLEGILTSLKSSTFVYPCVKVLMIQRKDTIGYTDFVRGKYPSKNSLKVYFSEMTADEQANLLYNDFDTIWNTLWLNHNSKTSRMKLTGKNWHNTHQD